MFKFGTQILTFCFFFFSFLSLNNCTSVKYLHYGLEGKNVVNISIFGSDKLDIKAIEKMELPGFSIRDYNHPLVREHIKFYKKFGIRFLQRVLNEHADIIALVKKVFEEQNIPQELVYLPIIESAYNTKAKSHAGAMGMWQFMYHTGLFYRLNANYWVDERRDPYRSTYAAAYHLKFLYKQFKDWPLVLAAYNAGSGKVSRGLKKYKAKDFWELSQYKYLKKETKNYVPKFIAMSLVVNNTSKYGISITNTGTTEFTQVEVEDATELNLISQSAEIPYYQFKRYNPHLNHWITPPAKKYKVNIPKNSYSKFYENLNQIPKSNRVTYRKYTVDIGDNLTYISKKFDIPINPIAEINKLKSKNDIKAFQKIYLPIRGLKEAKEFDTQYSTQKKKRKKEKEWDTFIHVFTEKDSLYTIAERYDLSIKDILRWNHLDSPNEIRAGRLLFLKKP